MNENMNVPYDRMTLRDRLGAIHMGREGWLLLATSLVPASLFWFGDVCENAAWEAMHMPAVHLAILLLSLLAVRKRARFTPLTGWLLASDAALILLGIIHRDAFLMEMNCLLIPMITGLTLLTSAGVNRSEPLSADSLLETLTRGFRGLFEFIPLPIFQLKGNAGVLRRAAEAILVMLICIPVLLIVTVLLADADEVFLYWFVNLSELLPDLAGNPILPRLFLTIVTALMLFSWSFSLTQRGRDFTPMRRPRIPAVFPAVLMTMLNVVYALFVYIQFSSLFGEAESAAMTGGYAQYARSGFFQLTAVAAINLLVVAISMSTSRSGWIRVMVLVMLAATGVILASALWRMRLYISVYGLTVLRVMTLWGMTAIAALLIVACVSLFAPKFRAFQAGMICLLVLWLALNAVNIDAIIANHNVDAYLSGELTEIDVEYLRSLSASEEALRRLEET